MKKYFSKDLVYSILALLFLLIIYFFGLSGDTGKDINTKIDEQVIQHDIEKDLLDIFVENNRLVFEGKSIVFSTMLSPFFDIRYSDILNIKGIIIDEIDVLSDRFFVEDEIIKRERNSISFIFPFLLRPGEHNLKIIGEKDNSSVTKDFLFNLTLVDYFEKSIKESQFLLIPETTQKKYDKSWFVENGKLKINSISEGDFASLSFFYPFVDINVSFEFIPYGENISLVFYFLNSGRSIIIGNGDNERILLLRGVPMPDDAIKGREFEMVPGKIYSAFIVRERNNYKVSIAEGSLNETRNVLTEDNLVLDFEDSMRINNTEDYVGFSVWKGSNGLEIDNLIISTNISEDIEYEF